MTKLIYNIRRKKEQKLFKKLVNKKEWITTTSGSTLLWIYNIKENKRIVPKYNIITLNK